MKILVNASINISGGALQVAYSFLKECRSYKEYTFIVVLSPNIDKLINRDSFPDNFCFLSLDVSNLLLHKYMSRIEKKYKPNVVFSIFSPVYWRPLARHIAGFAHGYYIYSDSPFFQVISLRERILIYIRKLVHCFYLKRDVDVFISETNDVTQRLKKLIPRKKYYTVSNTIGSHFFSERTPESKVFAALNISKSSYKILALSGFYPHKNLGVLNQVSAILKRRGYNNIYFIVTLPENVFIKKIKHENIKNIGVLSPSECPAIYHGVDFCIVPSLLECFTANYPEAMYMQKPILTSDLPFAHTLCGKAALYFDPLSPDDIADKIIDLVNNKDLQQKLVKQGLKQFKKLPSAEDRARKYLKILIENI